MNWLAFILGAGVVALGCVIVRESQGLAHTIAGVIFILAGFMFMVPALWR